MIRRAIQIKTALMDGIIAEEEQGAEVFAVHEVRFGFRIVPYALLLRFTGGGIQGFQIIHKAFLGHIYDIYSVAVFIKCIK